jgi:NADPH:quinone reductase-like Zn-dependent oxidoreductase
MKAIELTAPSLDALRATERPDPQAGRGEVLLRLRAATLNFVDVAIATGHFPAAGFPMIPVADGAGEVAALGAGVEGLALGDRVIPHFMPNWQGGAITPLNVAAMRGVNRPGSLADYVVVPAASLVALPAHLDFIQGAALPIAATTAWNALRSAAVRPGSVVLLLGTGGVSLFALQFAKASGATVILASSSDEKLARAQQLGADHLINYRATPAWDEAVLKLTHGRGADLVVETVGGATMARSLNAAAVGGTVFTVGFVTGTAASIDLLPVIVKALRVVGNNTITISRSHIWVMTARSWLTITRSACAAAHFFQQVEHLGLHRRIERRGRLVEQQDRGSRIRRGRWRRAGAGRRRAGADSGNGSRCRGRPRRARGRCARSLSAMPWMASGSAAGGRPSGADAASHRGPGRPSARGGRKALLRREPQRLAVN